MRTFLLFSVALTILSAQPLFFPSPPLALQYGPRTASPPSQVLTNPTLTVQQAPLLPYTPRTSVTLSAPILPYYPTTTSPAFPYTPRVIVPSSAPRLPYTPSSSSTILTPATTTLSAPLLPYSPSSRISTPATTILSAPLLPYTPTSIYTAPDVIVAPPVQLYTTKRNPSDVIVDSQGNTHNVFRYGPTEPASANNVLHPIDVPTAISLVTGAPGPKSTSAPLSGPITTPPTFVYGPSSSATSAPALPYVPLTTYGPPRTTVALNYAVPSAPAFPYVPTTSAPVVPYVASKPAPAFPYVPTTPVPALPYLTSPSTPVSVNPVTLAGLSYGPKQTALNYPAALLSYGPAQSQISRPPTPLSPDNTAVYVSAAAGSQRDTPRPVEQQQPQQLLPQQQSQQLLQQQLRQQLELQQELLLQQQAQLKELQQDQLDQQQQQQEQEQLQQQQRQQRQQQRQQQQILQQPELPLAPSSLSQPQPVLMPYVPSTPALSQEQQQQLRQQQQIQQQQQQQLQIQQQQLDQQLQQQQQQLQQQLLQQQQLQQQQQQLLMNQQQLAQNQQQLDLQQQQQNQQRQQQLQQQQLLHQQQLQLSQQQLPQLLQTQQLTSQQQALLYGTRTVAPTPAPRPTAAPTNYVMPFGWGFTTVNLTRAAALRVPTPADSSNQDAVTLPRPSRLNVSLAQIHGALLQTVNTTELSLPNATVVSFDFDGTLHDVLVGRAIGNPYPRVVAFLKEFGEAGAQVVIVTARLAEDNHLIEAFLARNDVAQYVTQIYNTETSDKTASLIAAGAQVHVDDRVPNLELLRTTIPTLKLYKVTNGVISAFN